MASGSISSTFEPSPFLQEEYRAKAEVRNPILGSSSVFLLLKKIECLSRLQTDGQAARPYLRIRGFSSHAAPPILTPRPLRKRPWLIHLNAHPAAMPNSAETPPLKPPSLASRLVNSPWPAPAFSLTLFVLGLILAAARAFPAPYYVFKLWEASILLHVVVGVALLIRGKTRDGTISLSLLCVPLVCFWLVS
jgi:hypothetical protein